eukprot:m.1381369 g.1381369  ORF g.1381369 m.1381369 type:complete len:213 (-) comp24970_c0_seq26:896-1534(-)
MWEQLLRMRHFSNECTSEACVANINAANSKCANDECEVSAATSSSFASCAAFDPETPVAYWKAGPFSSGPQEVQVTHGVTHTSKVSSASTWGFTATTSVSKGFQVKAGGQFFGIGASATQTQSDSDTTGTSQQVASTSSAAFSQSTTTTETYTFRAGQVWQWTWEFSSVNCGTSIVETDIFVSTPNTADCCVASEDILLTVQILWGTAFQRQ